MKIYGTDHWTKYIFSLHRRVPLLHKGQWCIRKMAASVTLGINTDGKKKVLTISVGENVKGVLIVYADGLTGIKEAIVVIFPKIGYRCCILPFLELRKNGLVRFENGRRYIVN